jgi:hypothetical protein
VADVRAHEHIAMLPTGYSLPLIHTALIGGSSQDTEPFDDDAADADADASDPPQPSMLYHMILTLSTRPRTHTPRAPFQR